MREIQTDEVEHISGGVVPLVAGAITVGKWFVGGFGAGVAVGSTAAILHKMR